MSSLLDYFTSMTSSFELIKSFVVTAPQPPLQGSSINFSDPFLLATVFFIFFNPLAWNFGGRLEYHTRLLTKICGGNKYAACYIFAVYIFGIGIIRDVV